MQGSSPSCQQQPATGKVSDGTRTRDRLDHNQELYLLSYAHHVDRPVARSAFGI
jgi:hypothetical protein